MISIIVPVYNEDKILEQSLPKIFELPLEKEVIIINDGSTDNSLEVLKKLKKDNDFELIDQRINQGKGASVKKGLENINGDYFIVCDADLEYNPEDIIKLSNEAKEDNLAIYGSRFLNHKPFSFHYFVNRALTTLTNILFRSKLTDMETCFKLIPSSALKKIQLSGKRFEIEPEITAQLLKRGYKIKELPINYDRRGYHEGKKITPKDGVLAVITLIKEKLKR